MSEQCAEIIEEAWCAKDIARLSDVSNTLGSCSSQLIKWSKQCFSNNKQRIEELKKMLVSEQERDDYDQ